MNGSDRPIEYTLTGRTLCLRGALGESIECQVCVSAIDARGHELYTCLQVSQQGTQTLCRPCMPRTRIPINLAEVAPHLQGYRPMFATAVLDPSG